MANIIQLPLENIPNQSFKFSINNIQYEMKIYVKGNSTYMDLEKYNSNTIFKGRICILNSKIKLYNYIDENINEIMFFSNIPNKFDFTYQDYNNTVFLLIGA